MAKLEDDLKIKVKVSSPEIRAVATVMNSMVFKKIIHDNTLTGDGDKEPLGIAPEILSDISTAKSDIANLKTADLQLETNILNLSARQSQTDTKITYINLDITNLQSDVSGLKSDVLGLQSNVSNALSSIQTDIAGLQSDISAVQTDVSNLQTAMSTINSSIGQVDAKFADYLPLSGGSMTGPLKFASNVGFASYDRLGRPIVGVGYVDNPYWVFDPQDDSFYPLLSGYMDLGQLNSKWRTIYAQRLATTEGIGYLEIPTQSGTLARVEDIPTLLSQLTNDLGFATSAEVQALIAALPKYKVEKVSALPETGEELVLYLVPKDGSTNDVYDEYIWEDGSYELLGTTQVDLSGYLPTTGGTLTGVITFNMPATSAYTEIPIIKAHNAYGGIDTVLSLGTNSDGLPSSSLLKATTLTLSERLNTKYIGRSYSKVWQLYAEKINDLTVPEETGTIARVEDLSNYVSVEEFGNTINGIATDFVQWVAFDGGTVGQVLTKTADGFSWQDAQVGDVFPDQTGNYGKFLITDGSTVSWSDTLSRGLTILTSNTFGSPMFSLSAGRQYEWTFYVQQTGLELHYGGYKNNVLYFPTTGGTLATTQNIADIGGAGTTGQVLTKTADGFSWQDSQGGGGTAETIQVSELPTPTESIDGKILQYVGETGEYENGLFYQCRDTSLQIYPIAYTEYIVDAQVAVSRAYELCELTPMVGDKVILDTGTHTSTHYCRIQIFRDGVQLKYYNDPITYPEINTEYGLSVPASSYYKIEFVISELPIGYAWVKKSVQTGYFSSTGITINYANEIAVDWNVVMTTTPFKWKDTSVSIGYSSTARDNYATAIGASSSASYGGVAIGYNAKTSGGIQIGPGGSTSNSDFYVGFFNGNNYKMLDRLSGKIPMERLDNVLQTISALPETPTYKQVIIWGGDSTLRLGGLYQYDITEWSYETTYENGVVLNSVDVSKFMQGAWFVGAGLYRAYTHGYGYWYVMLNNGASTRVYDDQMSEYGMDFTYTPGGYADFRFNITDTAGEWVEIGAGAEIGNINAVLDAINGEVV